MATAAQFRWERELSESFQESARPSLWSRRKGGTWVLARESACSEGRADLVWGRFEEARSLGELRCHAGLLQNLTCSRVLAVLYREAGLRAEDLRRRVGVSRPVLQKWLHALVEAGLIERDAGDSYSLIAPRKIPKAEICSFELKLKNWQRALYQATRYRSFSQRVFVVMPPSPAELACRHKDLFKNANVGLVSHDTSGQSRILVRPKTRRPHATYRTIMAIGMLSASNFKA
ncbi:MAG: helix-turn-helix domain-containing protein [Terracidiphilus sp.]